MKVFVNINKPSGMTSSDVVVKVRGILRKASGEKQKVGHLGTLDPIGTGVLPIAVGSATRLFDYMQEKVKVYRATFVFGQTTDTLDITGNITGECDVFPTKEQIDVAVSAIHGEIDQIPPQYSAKSVDGVRAYDFARKGIEVDLKPKRITIYYINYENNQIIRKRKSVGINLRFIFYTHDDLSFSFHRIHGKYYFETKKDNRNCPNL